MSRGDMIVETLRNDRGAIAGGHADLRTHKVNCTLTKCAMLKKSDIYHLENAAGDNGYDGVWTL